MKRMTDHDLGDMFRRHVPRNALPSTYVTFSDSPFYEFARELEHRSIAIGLAAQIDDPIPVIDTPAAPGRREGWGARAWLLIAWLIGK